MTMMSPKAMSERAAGMKAAKPIRVFDDEYLRTYSADHLRYEIWMFFQTGAVLPGGITSPRVDFVENAILESFVIHLRNLLDFFYSDGSRKDDVVAAKYFRSGVLPIDFPAKTTALNNAQMRAHKQVAHLTTARLPGGDAEKGWHAAPLMLELAKAIRAFTANAAPERLAPEFINGVASVLATIESSIQTPGTSPATERVGQWR